MIINNSALENEIQNVLESYQISARYLPHRSVYYVKKEPGLVLKPIKVGAIRAFLIGLLLSQQELCPIIPRLLKPISGSFYLWYRGNRYMLMEKLAGRIADYYSSDDVVAAIIAMSKFHHFSQDLLNSTSNQWSMLSFKAADEWKKRLREMEICREMAIRFQDDLFSRQYLQMWHRNCELAFRAIQGSQRVTILPSTNSICYHDWAFHNVIINQGSAYLIDFDYILIDTSVHDRANLISRYLRFNQWSVESLLKILWNFDRHYHWRKGDLKLLSLYLTFPYEYWMLGRQYYIEKQAWSKKYYQDQWERKIKYHEQRLKVLSLIDNME